MTNSWERRPNESAKSFQRFCCYRDMGTDRSLRRLAQELQLNVSTLAEHSAKYDWQTRVGDFDDFIERATQHNQVAQLRLMKRRQIVLALRAQRAAAKGLKKLIKEIETKEDCHLKPEGLSKLLDTGCRLERLNRDEPEHSLQIKQQQDFSRLDEGELEVLKQILTKAEGKP